MRSALTACLIAAALLVGCGGTGTPEGDASGSDCLVLANGTTLCDEKARAWCEGFASTTDRDTAQACDPVLPAAAQCDGYAPGTPSFLECVQRSDN